MKAFNDADIFRMFVSDALKLRNPLMNTYIDQD